MLQQQLGSLSHERSAEIIMVLCFYLQGVDKDLDKILARFGSNLYARVLMPSYADTLLNEMNNELPSQQDQPTNSG